VQSDYQIFKLGWLAVLPLTKDAIHIYIGFLCLLVALILFRRRSEPRTRPAVEPAAATAGATGHVPTDRPTAAIEARRKSQRRRRER